MLSVTLTVLRGVGDSQHFALLTTIDSNLSSYYFWIKEKRVRLVLLWDWLSDTDSDSRGGEGSPLESEGFRQTRGRFSKLSNEVWSAWGLFRHTMGH